MKQSNSSKNQPNQPAQPSQSTKGHSQKVNLPGSERLPFTAGKQIGPADPNQQIQVTIFLRRHPAGAKNFPQIDTLGRNPLASRKHISREDFAASYGASAEDLEKIRRFAAENGLQVKEEHPDRRTVILTGKVSDFSQAFEAPLQNYQHPQGTFRCRSGALKIPQELLGVVEGVFGLDNRPQARAHFRLRQSSDSSNANADLNKKKKKASSGLGPHTPLQVAEAYDYPSGANGSGYCIGILELGGGYNTSDLNTFFQGLNLKTPKVTAVSVDGGSNSPVGDPNSADAEVALDLEVAGAIAPSASFAVYFAPNTDQGFLDAITTAIHDTTNKPAVLSISWGGPESSWTAQAMNSLNSACQDAAVLGVSICVASGDSGASDGVSTGLHVDFPASSPAVLACGGTRIELSGETISSETVWNDLSSDGGATGGGVSQTFALPSWQQSANVPAAPNGKGGRGVPDVAGDADPDSGYQIYVDGQSEVVGGTSAVAPLWSALIALFSQQIGKSLGFLNPLLYTTAAEATFHDITSGNNDGYSAAKGWDPCTGWGSPDGAKLLAALSSAASAKSTTSK
jgi:kumamolisin